MQTTKPIAVVGGNVAVPSCAGASDIGRSLTVDPNLMTVEGAPNLDGSSTGQVAAYFASSVERREGSFLKSAVVFFKGVASVVSTKLRRKEVLEEELRYYLSSGNKSAAEKVAYRLGDHLWGMGDYDMAERAWIAGARVFLGDDRIGTLDDDPTKESVTKVLKNKRYLDEHKGVTHVSLPVGFGSHGDVYKVFGRPHVIKVMASEESLEEELSFFEALSSKGLVVPKIHQKLSDMFVRDLVYGPTEENIREHFFGLSEGEVAEALRKLEVIKREVRGKRILRDKTDALEINAIYEISSGRWVIIDP